MPVRQVLQHTHDISQEEGRSIFPISVHSGEVRVGRLAVADVDLCSTANNTQTTDTYLLALSRGCRDNRVDPRHVHVQIASARRGTTVASSNTRHLVRGLSKPGSGIVGFLRLLKVHGLLGASAA